jgi:hypothetical protein
MWIINAMKTYMLSGSHSVYLQSDEHEARTFANKFYPELESPLSNARLDLVKAWEPLSFRAEPPDSKPRAVFPDAIGHEAIRGLGVFVSSRARDILEPTIGAYASFLPVKIDGSEVDYFALIVTQLTDCLDIEKSTFSKPIPNSPRLIRTPVFKGSCLPKMLFRLQGGMGFQIDQDFATKEFLDFVSKSDLKGFRFRENQGSKFIEP